MVGVEGNLVLALLWVEYEQASQHETLIPIWGFSESAALSAKKT